MNRGFTFTALACAATVAFAANTVNPTFLWDGSTDTTGRVITGSSEETSGYWFTYNDANDNGTWDAEEVGLSGVKMTLTGEEDAGGHHGGTRTKTAPTSRPGEASASSILRISIFQSSSALKTKRTY